MEKKKLLRIASSPFASPLVRQNKGGFFLSAVLAQHVQVIFQGQPEGVLTEKIRFGRPRSDTGFDGILVKPKIGLYEVFRYLR